MVDTNDEGSPDQPRRRLITLSTFVGLPLVTAIWIAYSLSCEECLGATPAYWQAEAQSAFGLAAWLCSALACFSRPAKGASRLLAYASMAAWSAWALCLLLWIVAVD